MLFRFRFPRYQYACLSLKGELQFLALGSRDNLRSEETRGRETPSTGSLNTKHPHVLVLTQVCVYEQADQDHDDVTAAPSTNLPCSI
ncbi:hypothetical protein TGPRC2_295685 [Toxoplasma gondii TgCatPRC2]|uniref:Uncharacterized protein n=2 Tax=Toxoplasma gondii TaxID=5811 RepID=A0A151GZ89_TOXGO|nr:hypothetical protein TGARI_295685 [Toxoplasma gondii ARI]KYK62416.1 hypothetical protein TGPRC2_295685 [Toxoplasma gondii TgCatPRC2]